MRARSRYTVPNAVGAIWYSFERTRLKREERAPTRGRSIQGRRERTNGKERGDERKGGSVKLQL